jgi:diguanylate cyclase (GGDEF)-like protein
MRNSDKSLEDLKRSIYLWVAPFIIFSLILNTILQNLFVEDKYEAILNSTMSIWFLISWILLYKNQFVRFAEFSNLLLISYYHVSTVYDVIHNDIVKSGGGDLGDFIIWTPLILTFIFFTLGAKRGLYFSSVLFAITFIIGIVFIGQLPSKSIDSLTQFYFANFVYIIVLYFTQYLFKAYTEVGIVKKHAYLDSLTGIANRHQIDAWLDKKLQESEQSDKPFSIIFFDIDHFKCVNDRYGHKEGDSVLIELAELIKRNLAPGDLFGRWGGEEFIVITNAASHDAIQLAEHYRKVIDAHEFEGAGKITGSFGVTGYHLGDSIDTILNRVDKGLYRSKEKGRNLVSVI